VVLNKKIIGILCLLSIVLFAACLSNENADVQSTPNIVFILADDLGWADLPSYGNLFNEAPELDKLSKEGLRFTNAYAACPVCSPTRASIQSGQYPARVGVTDFITGHWRPYEELIVPKNRTQYLPTEIVTIAEALKTAGYATGYFGKWHLGHDKAHLPNMQGYDDWKVHRSGSFYNLKTKKAIINADELVTDDIRTSELMTDYSVNFIKKNRDQPFFLFLSHYDVHVQLDADEDLIQKYLDKPKAKDYPSNAIYAAMIEHIDRSVGRVVNTLDNLGLRENTLVVFFSDNGGLVSRFDKIPLIAKDKLNIYEGTELEFVASSNAPLRAEKGTIYEGGIREPLIISWPGNIEQGKTSEVIVSSVDFYPTFLELAGAEYPEQILDGIDIRQMVHDHNQEREIYWHYPVYHHDTPAGAIRKGDWKLIEHFNTNQLSLYNLSNDLSEEYDVSDINLAKTAELHQLLIKWREDVVAELPVRNPNFQEDKRYEWGRHPDRN